MHIHEVKKGASRQKSHDTRDDGKKQMRSCVLVKERYLERFTFHAISQLFQAIPSIQIKIRTSQGVAFDHAALLNLNAFLPNM